MAQSLSFVDAGSVQKILDDAPVLPLVTGEQAYRDYDRQEALNPPSQFLSYPQSPNRIISLLASTSNPPIAGCKVIASFPDNIRNGRPRASALITLHNAETGQPQAVLDGARISLSRTAASAVIGARHLANPKSPPRSMSVIGTGAIAARVVDAMVYGRMALEKFGCFDLDRETARTFANRCEWRCGWRIERFDTLDEALMADIVVFTTTAARPYVLPPHAFRPGQIVLNISLRDIAPELLLAAENVVDDVDHCLRAQTSPHLAEQLIGDRRFITGTLGDVMAGRVTIDHRKPVIFSPFGLGVLDISLAYAVWQRAEALGHAIHLDNFLGGDDRWG